MSTKLWFRSIDKGDSSTFTYLMKTRGSTLATYTLAVSAGSPTTGHLWTKASGVGVAQEFISSRVSTGFALTSTITFNVWGTETPATVNAGMSGRVFVLAANGSTETQVASANWGSPTELFNSTSVITFTAAPTSTNVATDERLIVRFYAIPVGSFGDGGALLQVNGATDNAVGDSYITFGEDIQFKTETITHTLKTTGGHYTAPSTWEAAQQDDLVTADVIKQLECYRGSFTDTGGINIVGWTTDATHYIRIFTPTTERHAARVSTGCTVTASGNTALTLNEDYITVEGMCWIARGSSSVALLAGNTISAANRWFIDSNIFINRTAQGGVCDLSIDTDARLTFTNNVIIGKGSAGCAIVDGVRECYFANNTIFGLTGGERGLVLGQAASTVHQYYNNAVLGTFASAVVVGAASTGVGAHNASSDNSANIFASSLTNVAAASCFVNTTTGKEDFRHLSTSPLLAAGTSYSVVTADIQNYPRDATTPSIGAHERYRGTVDLIGTSTVGGWRPDFPTLDSWVGWLATQSTLANDVTGAFLNEIFSPGNTVQPTGFITSSNAKFIVRAATSTETGGAPAKHNGLAGTGARITKTGGLSWGIFNISDQNIMHMEFRDLELYSNGSAGNSGIALVTGQSAVVDFLVDGCILYDIASGAIPTGSNISGTGTALVRNCILWNINGAGGITGHSSFPDRLECDNVTMVRGESDDAVGWTGIRYSIVKNCAVFNFGPTSSHRDFLNTGTGSSNNVSSDGSAPGTSAIVSVAASACFESVGGTWNLHLKSGSPLIGQGVFLANVSVDIDGQARGSTVDIGADEFFQTDSAVNQSVVLLWNIQERINNTLSVLWNIQERINKSYDTTWNINERIAKSYDVTYNIQERIAKTYEALYDIHERVKKDYDALWDIYERVGAEKLVLWNLEERVASQIAALWDIHERINKSVETVWNIEKLVAQDVSFTWNMEERIAKELEAIWNMEGGQPPQSLRPNSRTLSRGRRGQIIRLRGRT